MNIHMIDAKHRAYRAWFERTRPQATPVEDVEHNGKRRTDARPDERPPRWLVIACMVAVGIWALLAIIGWVAT